VHGLALDDDVDAVVPVVGAGGQDDVRIGAEVGELLLPGAGCASAPLYRGSRAVTGVFMSYLHGVAATADDDCQARGN
jgi:hypothetical protein